MYFNEKLSKEYGLVQSILLQHFAFWINVNKKKGVNFYDDKTWTYQTLQTLLEKFSFLTIDKIRYAIKKLVNDGVIIKGNYNKNKYDKTTWYAFKDDNLLNKITNKQESQSEDSKFPNGNVKNPTSCTKDKKEDNKKIVAENNAECKMQNAELKEPNEELNEDYDVRNKLKENNLSNTQIEKIVKSHNIDYIKEKINQFYYLLNNQPKAIKNKASYLYMSIIDNWINNDYEDYKKKLKPPIQTTKKNTEPIIRNISDNERHNIRNSIRNELLKTNKFKNDESLTRDTADTDLVGYFMKLMAN